VRWDAVEVGRGYLVDGPVWSVLTDHYSGVAVVTEKGVRYKNGRRGVLCLGETEYRSTFAFVAHHTSLLDPFASGAEAAAARFEREEHIRRYALLYWRTATAGAVSQLMAAKSSLASYTL
jgi:hypothetical protein